MIAKMRDLLGPLVKLEVDYDEAINRHPFKSVLARALKILIKPL